MEERDRWAEVREHVNKDGGRITQFIEQKGMTTRMEFTGEGMVKDSISGIETIAQGKFIDKMRSEDKKIEVPKLVGIGGNGKGRKL